MKVMTTSKSSMIFTSKDCRWLIICVRAKKHTHKKKTRGNGGEIEWKREMERLFVVAMSIGTSLAIKDVGGMPRSLIILHNYT